MVNCYTKLNYNSNNPLNGVFAHLKNVSKKTNISDDFIRIKPSSTLGKTIYGSYNMYSPIIDKNYQSEYWCSEDKNNSWYEIEFLKNRVYLESYFIYASQHEYFSNWKVLGSNNGIDYDVVDEVSGYTKPQGWSNYFQCKYPKTRRFFKIVASGQRFGKDGFFLCIRKLEFYGWSFKNGRMCSINTSYHHPSFVFCLIILCLRK